MNPIKYSEYPNDGIIIDIEDPITYQEFHLPNSQNIPYDKLMFNYKEYLHPHQKYYIYCRKGRKSKKATEILRYYGYNVVQIFK